MLLTWVELWFSEAEGQELEEGWVSERSWEEGLDGEVLAVVVERMEREGEVAMLAQV